MRKPKRTFWPTQKVGLSSILIFYFSYITLPFCSLSCICYNDGFKTSDFVLIDNLLSYSVLNLLSDIYLFKATGLLLFLI